MVCSLYMSEGWGVGRWHWQLHCAVQIAPASSSLVIVVVMISIDVYVWGDAAVQFGDMCTGSTPPTSSLRLCLTLTECKLS